MEQAQSLALRCRCGAVRGVLTEVSPSSGSNIVCYCDDCQTFARFLGGEGLVDGSGGSAIFQTAPAHVAIRAGSEHLRCMRLSPKGLLRWYTGCCNTPIANTLSLSAVPFAGLFTAFIASDVDANMRARALGPVIARTFVGFARGPVPEGGHPKVPVALLLRSARLLATSAIRGKAQPSPFFAKGAKEPRVAPRVLTKAERQAI